MSTFSYEEMTGRNIGFVTEEEQAKLRASSVFIAGVGGMGGAAVACLARAGIGRLVIADIDVFEVSNLNRQMFATLDTVGAPKAATTAQAIARINPECKVEVHGAEWTDELSRLLGSVDVAVNGCDDVRATLKMMRAAAGARTVIDAFAATLPNVYVVKPDDPRPEEVFGYPSVGREVSSLSPADIALCARREIEWVMAGSSSAQHVVMSAALQMVSGKRKRFSFAPMVWMSGCLMAYEAVRTILKIDGGPGVSGMFVNPWACSVEKPQRGPVGSVRRALVRRVLDRMMKGA